VDFVAGQPCPTPYKFHYDYVPAGLSAMRYPSQRQVSTTYDLAGRPSGVAGYATGVKYAPHGALKELTVVGSNLLEQWQYNRRLQPAVVTAGGLLSLTLDYGPDTNNNGNVLGQTIVAGGKTFAQTYTPDGLNRITQATESNGGLGWTQQFSYDAFGNRMVNPAPSTWVPTGFSLATNQATGIGWGTTMAGT